MDTNEPLQQMSERKRRVLERSRQYLMPNRVDTWTRLGVPLVIGRREGYRLWDIDGHELLDLHLNGGTYNLGHRHPACLAALEEALRHLDIGNHHFPAESRAALAEQLADNTPGDLHYSVFVPSGSEANDLAIRVARHVTGRRKVVALDAAYHGCTGLASAAGRDGTAQFFCSDYPDEFVKVPFDDLAAMAAALAPGDVAAVLMETIPATYGFPVPSDGYLPGVKALCERHGTLFVADEVQTGLGRTGFLWGIEAWNVTPDMLVIGKGLSGGLYPIAAVVMTKPVGAWLNENGWAYASTFGGAEIGCHVASTVLDICRRPESLANARRISAYLGSGLDELRGRHPFLKGIRRKGLVMGLELDDAAGALQLSPALYQRGVWAMFAGFDFSVLLDAALGDVERSR
jgi:putrescine aminotransferase